MLERQQSELVLSALKEIESIHIGFRNLENELMELGGKLQPGNTMFYDMTKLQGRMMSAMDQVRIIQRDLAKMNVDNK